MSKYIPTLQRAYSRLFESGNESVNDSKHKSKKPYGKHSYTDVLVGETCSQMNDNKVGTEYGEYYREQVVPIAHKDDMSLNLEESYLSDGSSQLYTDASDEVETTPTQGRNNAYNIGSNSGHKMDRNYLSTNASIHGDMQNCRMYAINTQKDGVTISRRCDDRIAAWPNSNGHSQTMLGRDDYIKSDANYMQKYLTTVHDKQTARFSQDEMQIHNRYLATEITRLRDDIYRLNLQNSQNNMMMHQLDGRTVPTYPMTMPINITTHTNVATAAKAENGSGNNEEEQSIVNQIVSSVNRFFESRLNQFFFLCSIGMLGYILVEQWQYSWRMAQISSRSSNSILLRLVKVVEDAFNVKSN